MKYDGLCLAVIIDDIQVTKKTSGSFRKQQPSHPKLILLSSLLKTLTHVRGFQAS